MAVIDPEIEFAQNAEPRCPCVLLLDVSGSMSGTPIAELNRGLRLLQTEIQKDPVARRRVDLAVLTFGNPDVTVVQDFITAEDFIAPELETGGITPMGAAIHCGLDLLRQRKAEYQRNGIVYYRPWIFLITDGYPSDKDQFASAAGRVQQEYAQKGLTLFPIGVEGADLSTLAQLGANTPVKLAGLAFDKLFVWLSNSLGNVSVQDPRPGAQAALAPIDWLTVETA